MPFPSFQLGHSLFPLLFLQPCSHSFSLLSFFFFPPRQCPFLSQLSGIVSCVHLFPSVVAALVIETVLSSCEDLVGPSGLSLLKFLGDTAFSGVCLELLSSVMIVGHARLSRSPRDMWVPARPVFLAQMDLTSIVVACYPTHGGMWYHLT